MIVIFVEFIDQLIDYPINRASLSFYIHSSSFGLVVCSRYINTITSRLWLYRLVRAVHVYEHTVACITVIADMN